MAPANNKDDATFSTQEKANTPNKLIELIQPKEGSEKFSLLNDEQKRQILEFLKTLGDKAIELGRFPDEMIDIAKGKEFFENLSAYINFEKANSKYTFGDEVKNNAGYIELLYQFDESKKKKIDTDLENLEKELKETIILYLVSPSKGSEELDFRKLLRDDLKILESYITPTEKSDFEKFKTALEKLVEFHSKLPELVQKTDCLDLLGDIHEWLEKDNTLISIMNFQNLVNKLQAGWGTEKNPAIQKALKWSQDFGSRGIRPVQWLTKFPVHLEQMQQKTLIDRRAHV